MRLIRLKDVTQMTGLSRSSVYRYMDSGNFPPSVSLGGKLVAWVEDEVEDWVATKVAERDFKRIDD